MMPHHFKEANTIYTKPQGWTDEDCSSISACVATVGNGDKVIVTFWKPSYEDIQAIMAGGGIYMTVFGNGLPPISLTTESPFDTADDLDGE